MKSIAVLVSVCLGLIICHSAVAQQPGPLARLIDGSTCSSPGIEGHGKRWAFGCFPRCGCPDDYCPHPLPRQCWPPYPPFYQCVPAGDCGQCPVGSHERDRLSLWFIPTPRALVDAFWCHP